MPRYGPNSTATIVCDCECDTRGITRSYALLYKGMIDGIISLAGFHVTNTFRKNRNSGEYEFIITTLCSVAFNK